MRILWVDIDSLRPDHLGCYGYPRNTSPNIDRIALDGLRFTGCYTSDAPCLPSRTALATGRFGIHTGVVGHGGTAADPFPIGPDRPFGVSSRYLPFFSAFQKAGFHTASVSSFAQRHAAWWFLAGLCEWINTGRNGLETADEINAAALPWLERYAREDNWLLHVNYWDPHGPYRTPESYGDPFAEEALPPWYTERIRQAHFASYGPHSAQDTREWDAGSDWPRVPASIASLNDWRRWINGYDTGIRYADDRLGELLDLLAREGVLEETAIIVTSDHGENLGELNVYGDHQTADHWTMRVPFILRWPGLRVAGANDSLLYQTDLAATVLELAGGAVPAGWDAESFAAPLAAAEPVGRDVLMLSQMAWSVQRSVRWVNWLLVRTYHTGFKDFPPVMLFDIVNDPHETRNLAVEEPDVVAQGLAALEEWHALMMATTTAVPPVDPMQTVLREGGPYHVARKLPRYAQRLRETGRAHHAETLERQYGGK